MPQRDPRVCFAHKKKATSPRRPANPAPEAAILGAAPSNGLAVGEETPVPLGGAVPGGGMTPVGTGVVELP